MVLYIPINPLSYGASQSQQIILQWVLMLYAQNLENGECHSRRISHDGLTVLCDMGEIPLSHFG